MLLLRKVSTTLAISPGRLLLLGCLLIPSLTRADTITCTQIGPTTIQITEQPLVLGTPEPLNEVNACVLPTGFAAPLLGAFFDLVEPNPANPLLPVSDYFDITSAGLVTLTSDPLELGLARRLLIATAVPEVGPEGSNGATITVAGVTYVVISDGPGGSVVAEPSSMLLALIGVAMLGISKYRNRGSQPGIPR